MQATEERRRYVIGVAFEGGADREQLFDAEGAAGQDVCAQEGSRANSSAGAEPSRQREAVAPVEGEAGGSPGAARLEEGVGGREGHAGQRLIRLFDLVVMRVERRSRPQVEGEAKAVETGPEVGRRGRQAQEHFRRRQLAALQGDISLTILSFGLRWHNARQRGSSEGSSRFPRRKR